MTIYYRKNYASAVLSIALVDSPGYVDDPLYDEIAVDTDHTLPNSTEVPTLTEQFRLIIWSNTIDPGDAPDMEIVTVTRTSHPRVYQIATRGEEDTGIVAHAVGSRVGLHYTAGISNADLEPILAVLAAAAGSIVYAWTDVFGNKSIAILEPSNYGKVLVTAGDNKRPFWDWVWGAPGASYGGIKQIYITIETGLSNAIITMDVLRLIECILEPTEFSTNFGPNAERFQNFTPEDPSSFVDGPFELTITDEILNLSGDSDSDPTYKIQDAAISSTAQVTMSVMNVLAADEIAVDEAVERLVVS